MTGLLCQKERGLKKQRESKRSGVSEEGEKLGPWGGGTAGTGGVAEGNSRYWRGCGGRRGRSALVRVTVRSVCTVVLVKTWTSRLEFKPGCETQAH